MSVQVSPARRRLRGLALPLVLLALWWLAFAFHIADERIVASIGDVGQYFAESLASGDLWIDLSASLGRNLIGFGLGAVAGIIAGVLLSLSRTARDLVLPSIDAFKQVSIFAWVPMISVWFGLGEGARVFVIAFAVWFPVLYNTLEGVAGVSPNLLELARVYRFSPWQRIRHVILPAALPSIFTGIYVGLVMSWMVTLGAEYMLTATRGIGHLLLDGRENFRMDQVIVGIVVVGLIGFGLHVIADTIEKRALAWRGQAAAGHL